MFIPIVNIFALGFLFRFGNNLIERESTELPDWSEWPELFMNGLKLLAVFALYGIVPCLIGWGISSFLSTLSLHMLGVFPYFPLAIAILIAMPLKFAALYHFQKQGTWDSLMDIKAIFNYVMSPEKRLILVPTLTLIGLLAIGIPVFGLAFFLGFLIVMPYYYSLFSSINTTHK